MDVIGRLFGRDRGVVRRAGHPEAVVVVPGITIGVAGRRSVARFFGAAPYDLFFLDYLYGATLHRCSLEGAVENLQGLLQAHGLEAYARVHVFANILGGWTVNLALRSRPLPNLASIVYDRSPIQERAPAVVSGLLPVSTRTVLGRVVEDVAATPYPALHGDGVRVGLVIEDRASLLMRMLRRSADRMGPYAFEAERMGQRFDDALHVALSHDEIYTGIDSYGPAVLRFFRDGAFPDHVRREPHPGDPFRWRTGPGDTAVHGPSTRRRS